MSSCEAKIAFKPLEIETPFLLEDFLFLYSQNQFTQGLERIKWKISRAELKDLKEVVYLLYSKRTTGYPLSPHIKTIAVAFLQAEI